jgi:hypothetical protein
VVKSGLLKRKMSFYEPLFMVFLSFDWYKGKFPMDVKKLNERLLAIAEAKNKLSKLNYSDKNYDDVEEELHDLEDDFLEDYGDFFEDILQDIHDEHCPETDVLLPIAYMANKYKITGKKADGTLEFDVEYNEGVLVEADAHPGIPTRLVMVPNPPRIYFQIGKNDRKEVWKAE